MARIVTVAIFVFTLNMMIAFLAESNSFWTPQAYTGYDPVQEINRTMSEWNPNIYSGIGLSYIFGDFLRATTFFVRVFTRTLYMVPYLTGIFLMPEMLAYIVQTIVWIIYFLGFLELVGGRRL